MIVRIPRLPNFAETDVPVLPPKVGFFALSFVKCPSCGESDQFVFDAKNNAWSCVKCYRGVPVEAMAVFRADMDGGWRKALGLDNE